MKDDGRCTTAKKAGAGQRHGDGPVGGASPLLQELQIFLTAHLQSKLQRIKQHLYFKPPV